MAAVLLLSVAGITGSAHPVYQQDVRFQSRLKRKRRGKAARETDQSNAVEFVGKSVPFDDRGNHLIERSPRIRNSRAAIIFGDTSDAEPLITRAEAGRGGCIGRNKNGTGQ